MKKTIIPIILIILLMSLVSAQLTYESTISNVIPTDTIRGLTTHNNELVLFLTNTSIITLNETHDITSNIDPTLSYQLSTPTSDGTYIYTYASSVGRIYKLDPTNNYAVISYKTIIPQNFFPILTSPLSLAYNTIGNNILIGYGSGLIVYDYETNTEINNFVYDEILSFGDQYFIVSNFGDNFYIGVPNETIQINTNYDILENLQEVINYKSGNDYTFFNDYFYQRASLSSNDLYRYTTTDEVETDYIYISGNYYSPNQCIDTGSEFNYIFCNDSSFQQFTNSIGIYCNTDAETLCEGICITTTLTTDEENYISGACDTTDCTNECVTTGTSTSTGLTTYRICGNYDNDICLEYGSVQTCDTGSYYRLDPTQPNPYCAIYNYSSFDTTFQNSQWYPTINEVSNVVDYSRIDLKTIINTYLAGMNLLSSYSPFVSDDNEYFKSKYLENAYDVHSTLNVAYANIGIVYPVLIDGEGYASITCDHEENIIKESDEQENINSTRTITTSITGGIITTRLTYTLNDTDNMRTTLKRVAPSLIHTIDLNVTNKTMLVYSNAELIFNQTTAKDILLVNLYCDYDFTNLYRGCYVFISDGDNDYNVYETPVSFNNSETPLSSYYSITPSDSITVEGYTISSISSREGFQNIQEGTYPFTCEIFEGGQIIRTYQNNGIIPSYLDYKDIYLDVELGTLTPTQEQADNTVLGFDTTETSRLILAILISLFIGVAIIFATSSKDGNNTTGGFIGASAFIGGLIIFSIIGWLPAFIPIIIFIVGAGITAIVFRKGVMGA